MKQSFKERIGKLIGKTLTGILFCFNICAWIMLGISISSWYIPPYRLEIPVYLGLGFFAILGVNVLFLLFWLIMMKWRNFFFNLIILSFCWIPIHIYFPINRKTEVIPENTFKLLSYNVRGFNWEKNEAARENPILEYLRNSNADIICLQEFVINNKKYNPKGLISIAELDDILDEYPYRSIVKLGESEGVYSYGVACYSKFPIIKTKKIPLESEINGSALYEIRIGKKVVTLINNHLESNRLTDTDKQLYRVLLISRDTKTLNKVTKNIHDRLGTAYQIRAKQADLISQWIKEQDTDATIVCGDFNDTPISYTYNTIARENLLVDSYVETGMGQGITYHENMFWFRIDYILYTRNLETYNCTVDKVAYSDHYPIYSYIRFK